MIAKDFLRIHRQNLVNFGVLPLTFADKGDYDRLQQGDVIELDDLRNALGNNTLAAKIKGKHQIKLEHQLSLRQVKVLLGGGLINWIRARNAA